MNHADNRQPTRYVWVVDGDLSTGTIGDYAEEWESCKLLDGNISDSVWRATSTGELAKHMVEVEFHGRDHNDYLNYTLTIEDTTVCANLDGRA